MLNIDQCLNLAHHQTQRDVLNDFSVREEKAFNSIL